MAGSRAINPELLLEHSDFVRAAARAAIGYDEAVEDAVQDTFTIALTKAPRSAGALRGWLGAIARNRALDLVRKRTRMQARERRVARPEAVDSTLTVVGRAETGRILIDAVLSLPKIHREAILLRYYDGLPPRRIGQVLGISTEAARTRVKRGLRQLRGELDDRHGGDRRHWSLLLAPLLPRANAAAATLALGTVLMKKTIVIVAVLLVGVSLWKLGSQLRSASDTSRADQPGGGAHLVRAGDHAAAAESVAAGALSITGIVRRAGLPIAGRVELRRIDGMPTAAPLRWYLDPRAALRAIPSGNRPLRTIQSAKDGTFRIDGVAEGRYEVRGIAQDSAWGFVTTDAFEGAGAPSVEIRIHGGAHGLAGRITFADARPFQGHVLLAPVFESFRGPRFRAVACVETAADGRFRIESLAPGAYYLAAVEPNRSRSVRLVHVPATAPVEIVIDANLRTVRGRVVARDGGAPVPRASVVTSYGSEDFDRFERAGLTNPEGRFSLPAGRGQAQLRVRAPGFESRFLRLAKGADADLTIELRRPAFVTGTVRRADGHEPVAGVPVYAAGTTERGYLKNEFVVVRSDDDGRFELPGTATGEIAVFALGDGWASEGLASWKVSGANPFAIRVARGARAEVALDVVPTAHVVGTLMDAAGAACAGATITAQLFQPARARRSPPALYGLWHHSPLGAGRQVRTDDEGRFSFPHLIPGAQYVLSASHSGYAAAQSASLEVASGETRTIELRLQEPRSEDVEVTDEESGEPIAGAVLTLFERISPRGTRSTLQRWVTGDDGRVRLGPLPPGSYALWLAAAGYLPVRSLEATAFEIGEREAGQIRVAMRRGLRVTGHVVAPEGVTIAGTRVTALVEGYLRQLGTARWRNSQHVAWCAPDGTFTFDSIAPGRYELRAEVRTRDKVFAGEVGLKAGAGEVTLSLEDVTGELPKGRLVVRVRDPDGALVPQANLVLGGASIAFQEPPFLMPYAPQRGGWLFVSDAQDMAGQRMPVGSALVGPLEAGRRVIDVTLPPERRIQGHVIGADEAGRSGVEVLAIPVRDRMEALVANFGRHKIRAVTAADGSFELRYLGDFDYELRASVASATARIEPVRVHAGADDVRIRIDEAVVGRMELRDWRGQPVAGARLRFRVDPGEQAGKVRERATSWRNYVSTWWDERMKAPVTSDSKGALSLPGLDPDRVHELYVEGPANRYDLKPIVKLAWRPGEAETLVFDRAWRIRGVVIDAAGAPVAKAQVVAVGTKRVRGTYSDARGRFSFEGLSGPELDVRIALGSRIPKEAPTHHLQAGVEPVTVRIDAGAEVRIRVADWGPARFGAIACLSRTNAPLAREHRQRVDTDGRLRIRGLDAHATYVLWIPLPGTGGLHVYKTGLRPGKAETVVQVQEGQELRGRVRFLGEKPADEIRVQTRRGDISAVSVVSVDGSFVFRGLPAGIYPVRAIAYRRVQRESKSRPGLEWIAERTVEVRTGEEVAIDIRPGDRR